MWGRFAEYEVCLVGGGRRWVSWKRFSNFKHLAASSSRVDHICDTAWARVMMSRLHYRCLNPVYLARKCRLLEMVSDRCPFICSLLLNVRIMIAPVFISNIVWLLHLFFTAFYYFEMAPPWFVDYTSPAFMLLFPHIRPPFYTYERDLG